MTDGENESTQIGAVVSDRLGKTGQTVSMAAQGELPYHPDRFELVQALPRIERHLEFHGEDYYGGVYFSGVAWDASRSFFAGLYFQDCELLGALSELPDSEQHRLHALYAEMDVPKEHIELAPLYLMSELDGEESASILRLLHAEAPGSLHKAIERELPTFFRSRPATHLGCVRLWD